MIDIILEFHNKVLVNSFKINPEAKLELDKEFIGKYKDMNIKEFLANYQINDDFIEVDENIYMFQLINLKDQIYILLSYKYLSNILMESAVDYLDQGMQIYDKDGYFLYGNKKSEELEEYNIEDFKGKHVLELYDLKEEFSTVLTILRTKEPVINRCDRFKVRSGKTLTTINTGYPIIENGKLYGAVVFESDVSSIKSFKKRSLDFESYLHSKKKNIEESMYRFTDIIHESEIMKNRIEFARKISSTDSSVLIEGETGTGKELFAQSIHVFGARRFKPFIDVNCSAIPNSLFEGLFFGTESGSFTGSESKEGFFEQANGGTLFLDEINSISLDKQAKLLRAIEEKKIQRLGGTKKIDCDIRIIAATNENLEELIKTGKIREDFYYRISAVKITIPPLRERKTDINSLSNFFLKELKQRYSFGPDNLSTEVLDAFFAYDWPGNVRELKNIIEFAFNNSGKNDSYIHKESLPEFLQNLNLIRHKKDIYNSSLNELLNNFEKEIIIKYLNKNDNNITRAATALGISRQNLQYRIKKNDINLDAK